MPWVKLKNVILLILVITNLCLLALVAGQAIQDSRLRSRAREDAIQFLRNRGVQVEEEQVPQAMELLPQTAERDMAGEEEAAAALLQGPVAIQARGGEVYRYYNDNGAVQFHSDGTFSAQLKPEIFPLGTDRRAACLELLGKIGFQGILLEEKGDELTFCQSWKGWPLFTQQVTLMCQGGGLVSMSGGRRLVGEPLPDQTRQPVTVATALIDFFNGVSALGDVCNRIDQIQPGYVTASSLSGTMTMTPVWRVTTDTGAYQVDTISGGVSRVS